MDPREALEKAALALNLAADIISDSNNLAWGEHIAEIRTNKIREEAKAAWAALASLPSQAPRCLACGGDGEDRGGVLCRLCMGSVPSQAPKEDAQARALNNLAQEAAKQVHMDPKYADYIDENFHSLLCGEDAQGTEEPCQGCQGERYIKVLGHYAVICPVCAPHTDELQAERKRREEAERNLEAANRAASEAVKEGYRLRKCLRNSEDKFKEATDISVRYVQHLHTAESRLREAEAKLERLEPLVDAAKEVRGYIMRHKDEGCWCCVCRLHNEVNALTTPGASQGGA